jgi:DNA-binding transcriptional ArsR family regulator
LCDIMRTLRCLFNVGLVSDRREGTWINYLAMPPGCDRERFIKLLGEMLAASPEAQVLRAKLEKWLKTKAVIGQEESCVC